MFQVHTHHNNTTDKNKSMGCAMNKINSFQDMAILFKSFTKSHRTANVHKNSIKYMFSVTSVWFAGK